MIRATRVLGRLAAGYETGHGEMAHLSTGRIAAKMSEILQIVNPRRGMDDRAGEGAQDWLETTLDIHKVVTFSDGEGNVLIREIAMGYVDAANGDVIVGAFIGDDPHELSLFYEKLFGLTPEEISQVNEEWLGFFVYKLPGYSAEPFTVAAVMATGDDAWGPDAYNLPEGLRGRILAAAKPILDRPS